MTLLLSLLACSEPGTVSLDVPGATGEDLDGDGIPDDEQEEEEPVVHAALGIWTGGLGLYVPEWDWDFCEGDIKLEVDEEGGFFGSADCVSESDWGTQEIPADIEGEIDEDGEVTGVIVFNLGWGGGADTVEGDLEGNVDDDELALEWVSELSFGGGGGGSDREVEGWAELGLD